MLICLMWHRWPLLQPVPPSIPPPERGFYPAPPASIAYRVSLYHSHLQEHLPGYEPQLQSYYWFTGNAIWPHLVAISLDSLSFSNAHFSGFIQEWAAYWILNSLITTFSKPQFWTILPTLKSLKTQHFQLPVLFQFHFNVTGCDSRASFSKHFPKVASCLP